MKRQCTTTINRSNKFGGNQWFCTGNSYEEKKSFEMQIDGRLFFWLKCNRMQIFVYLSCLLSTSWDDGSMFGVVRKVCRLRRRRHCHANQFLCQETQNIACPLVLAVHIFGISGKRELCWMGIGPICFLFREQITSIILITSLK